MSERIHLSVPHMGGEELDFVRRAFDSNWIAPLGPNVDAFEGELAESLGVERVVATVSGTAALHVALRALGIGPGDVVLVSTLTFVASVTPIVELGATPVFIDAQSETWNLDPALVVQALAEQERAGRRVGAVVAVDLYGQCADMDPLRTVCEERDIWLVEDAAEALGATYRGRPAGTLGDVGVFSFNGNKIITTAGGGAMATDDPALADRVHKLITQAREPVPHYEHRELGFNYRMSNVLAGIGRGQLRVLAERVEARRSIFDFYQSRLGRLPGLEFMPEAEYGRSTRWLTCATVDEGTAGIDREWVRSELERRNIEARPVWKPMHLQPALRDYPRIGGAVAENLFERGICLPSSSSLRPDQLERVVDAVTDCWETS